MQPNQEKIERLTAGAEHGRKAAAKLGEAADHLLELGRSMLVVEEWDPAYQQMERMVGAIRAVRDNVTKGMGELENLLEAAQADTRWEN